MISKKAAHKQEDALLQAFMDSPGHQLDSDQIRNVEGIGQATARLSGLRKRGHIFRVVPIPHSTKVIYTHLRCMTQLELDQVQRERDLRDTDAALKAEPPKSVADLNRVHGYLIVAADRVVFKPASTRLKAQLLYQLPTNPSQPKLAL